MNILDKINAGLNKMLIFLGGIFLVGMVLLTCSNIFFRITWVPVKGTFELMGYFGALVAAFSLGHTQLQKGHIAVDVLINSFSQRLQLILRTISSMTCAIFFLIAAWQVAIKATNLMRTDEVTETLRIIYYPFTYAVAFGCLFLALTLIADVIANLFPEKGGEN